MKIVFNILVKYLGVQCILGGLFASGMALAHISQRDDPIIAQWMPVYISGGFLLILLGICLVFPTWKVILRMLLISVCVLAAFAMVAGLTNPSIAGGFGYIGFFVFAGGFVWWLLARHFKQKADRAKKRQEAKQISPEARRADKQIHYDLTVVDQVLAMNPSDVNALRRKFYLLTERVDFIEMSNIDKALEIGQKIQKLAPWSSEGVIMQADMYFTKAYLYPWFGYENKGDNIKGALKYYTEALSCEPNNVSVLLKKATVEIFQEDFKAAERSIQRAEQINPNHPMVRITREEIEDLSEDQFLMKLGIGIGLGVLATADLSKSIIEGYIRLRLRGRDKW